MFCHSHVSVREWLCGERGTVGQKRDRYILARNGKDARVASNGENSTTAPGSAYGETRRSYTTAQDDEPGRRLPKPCFPLSMPSFTGLPALTCAASAPITRCKPALSSMRHICGGRTWTSFCRHSFGPRGAASEKVAGHDRSERIRGNAEP